MVFFVLLMIVFSFLIWEKNFHERRLRSIPIRILVNGTRGKTSVTRLISSALRRAGIRTVAKTTGDRSTLILPDGREEIFRRRGPARIQEQIAFVSKAVAMGAEAIVVECMAVDPRLQFVSGTRMIKPTMGVITNVRADHLETMGETLDEIAEALSLTIPSGGSLVVGDESYLELFKSEAAQKNTIVRLAGASAEDLRDSDPGLFFPENVAVTREICSLLNVRMPHGLGTEGRTEVIRVPVGGRTIHFIDAFSANDVHSSIVAQNALLSRHDCPRPFVALLNNRADRPLRIRSFVSYLSSRDVYEYIALVGESRWLARRFLRRAGRREKVLTLGSREPAKLLDEICGAIPQSEFTLFGLGNYRGIGARMSDFLYRESGKQGGIC